MQSTGRSPIRDVNDILGPELKKIKTESMSTRDDGSTGPDVVNGVEMSDVSRLPRSALLDLIRQMLQSSSVMKALVLSKLSTEQLLTLEELEEEELDDNEEEVDDADATDIEELSGEEADSSQQSSKSDTGPLAGLSVLAKLIMEVMNSAPAPEGGMPWREFEGIWPPIMGTVPDAIRECVAKGLLDYVAGNDEFVISTMPMVETVLEQD